MADLDGFWTNEKHISFLNWIEASFVRKMLGNEQQPRSLTCALGAVPSHPHRSRPPLDRFLPDSAESTLDFSREKTRAVSNGTCDDGEKERKESSRPYNASQDQVVPQLGSTKRDVDLDVE